MTSRDTIVAMFLPSLLCGSLLVLLVTRVWVAYRLDRTGPAPQRAAMLIREWVAYRFARSGPAAEKAEALIREWLSPAQLCDYEKSRKFRVAGSAGGRYLIVSDYIRDLDTGDDVCFGPENSVVLPAADVMLACKIALENDEIGVLRVARRWPNIQGSSPGSAGVAVEV